MTNLGVVGIHIHLPIAEQSSEGSNIAFLDAPEQRGLIQQLLFLHIGVLRPKLQRGQGRSHATRIRAGHRLTELNSALHEVLQLED